MRPSNRLNLPLYLLVALSLASAVLIVSLAVSQPWIGARLAAEGDHVVLSAIDADGPASAVAPGARLVGLRAPGDPGPGIAIDAIDLIEEPDGLPTIAAMEAFFRKQGRMNDILSGGPAELIVSDGAGTRPAEVTPLTHRPLATLPFTFWMQLAVGMIAMLLGGWVLAIRRDETGARYLALSALGLMMSAHAAALYSSRALPLPGAMFEWVSAFNSLGALIFGIGMVNLFLVYPARYLPNWVPALVTLVFGTWAAASFLRVTGTPAVAIHIPTVVLMTGILLGAVGQVIATRGMPDKRAALRWFGLSVTIGAGSFVSLVALPQVFGLEPQISQSYAFALFLIIYAGLALGVARYRLFDLEFWAFRALFYAGGVAILLLVDALLVYSVSLDHLPAFSISLMLVTFIYLPARDQLTRWLSGQRETSTAELFDLLSGIALSPEAELQKAKFHDLLDRLFHPMNISDAPCPVDKPRLGEGGGTMDVPGLDGVTDIRMSWPHNGRRLFSAQDVQRVTDILKLGVQFVERRRAYEAGAMQERQRINRDMHDNVGVQLLGALHSSDHGRKNALIRQALTDLRDMVSNSGGGPFELRALLADLRAEMFDYLASADIMLRWNDESVPDITVAQPVVNAVRSTLREGISNILRHAEAGRTTVAFTVPEGADPQWLTLRIDDDGRGLGGSLNAAQIKGNGLRNLRSRSEAWGGAFDIKAGSGGSGTVLRVAVPLNRPADGIVPLSDAGE